jgi:hypothetical protein
MPRKRVAKDAAGIPLKRVVNGRAKGSRGELMVANIIANWWHRYEPAARFIRTPLSGGWQHGDRKVAAHFKACGDLMSTTTSFPFCVEVKWREQWSINSFLDGKLGSHWEWWRQTVAAAKHQDGVPMMWLRKNRVKGSAASTAFPWLVVLPLDYVQQKDLSAPDVAWSEHQLLQAMVDYANVLPVAYIFTRFIEMAPQRMKRDDE